MQCEGAVHSVNDANALDGEEKSIGSLPQGFFDGPADSGGLQVRTLFQTLHDDPDQDSGCYLGLQANLVAIAIVKLERQGSLFSLTKLSAKQLQNGEDVL